MIHMEPTGSHETDPFVKEEHMVTLNRRGEPYMCTIVMSRYSGVYSGARWLAFPLWNVRLPNGWDGDDITCMKFWQEYEDIVGKGSTPEDAYSDLLKKLQ